MSLEDKLGYWKLAKSQTVVGITRSLTKYELELRRLQQDLCGLPKELNGRPEDQLGVFDRMCDTLGKKLQEWEKLRKDGKEQESFRLQPELFKLQQELFTLPEEFSQIQENEDGVYLDANMGLEKLDRRLEFYPWYIHEKLDGLPEELARKKDSDECRRKFLRHRPMFLQYKLKRFRQVMGEYCKEIHCYESFIQLPETMDQKNWEKIFGKGKRQTELTTYRTFRIPLEFRNLRFLLQSSWFSKDVALRLLFGILAGAVLIAPMVIMIYQPSRTKSVLTTSITTILLAIAISIVTKPAVRDLGVLQTAAAVAAVLVVFVGTSGTVSG